ncbi:MAG: nucleotidyltransferase family protein [Bacteroidales bacterium]|nr:nucleotidyltransferase family protein [Bacteroidales bacterium]
MCIFAKIAKNHKFTINPLVTDQYKKIFSPEEQLLVDLIRNEITDNASEGSLDFKKDINCELLFSLIERHRLIPTSYIQLKNYVNVPENLFQKLHEKYETNTRRMLSLATEMARVFSFFDDANIPFIVLKGPLFAKWCYGDFSMRQSRDIDILIHPDNLQQAEDLFKTQGYKRISPDIELTPKQYKVNLKGTHEYSFMHPDCGNLIEMHWRMFTMQSQLPVTLNEIFRQAEVFELAGKKLNVLNSTHLVLYLLVHGSIHAWFRLFWLRDIGYYMKKHAVDMNHVLIESKRLGVDRSVIQGLVLSNLLFDTSIPDDIKKEYKSSSGLQKLVKSSLHAITSRQELNTTSKIARVHRPIYLMHLRREWKYKFNCIYKLRTNVSDWKVIKLPDGLFFLYTILRPFTWFYNAYLKRTMKDERRRTQD